MNAPSLLIENGNVHFVMAAEDLVLYPYGEPNRKMYVFPYENYKAWIRSECERIDEEEVEDGFNE
jgi:hypothetical protein